MLLVMTTALLCPHAEDDESDSQGRHAVPLAAANEPAAHFTQAVEPHLDTDPAGHALQALEPTEGEYWPASQGLHVPVAFAANEPAAQA